MKILPNAIYGALRHARGFAPLALAAGYLNKEIASDSDGGSCYVLPTVQAGMPMTVKEMGWRLLRLRQLFDGYTLMPTPTIIEVTAGEIAEELRRRGISADEPVKLTIETTPELIPGRRESRARVVAAGLTDDDIDRMIKQAQREVEPNLG